MAACTDCSAALEPQWKYCVRCGAVVEGAIPNAIRPGTVEQAAHVAPLAIFLWSLGALLGLVVVTGVAVVLFFRS